MKIKKTIVSLCSSFVILGFSSLSVISCGQHNAPNKWDQFKNKALAETATNLKSDIADITKYHWKIGDQAIFSNGGIPTVVANKQEISATIVIAGASGDLLFPINFDIKYQNNSYDLKKWTYSQNIPTTPWEKFKKAAMLVTSNQLVVQAQVNQEVWKSFKWIGNDTQSVWPKDPTTAEFDTFGYNLATDSYKGMNGKPKADDITKTITAIISIPGKNGAYDSNPIKATISNTSSATYDLKNWTFTQDTQLQSNGRFKSLSHVEYAKAALVTGNRKASSWTNFATTNWVDPEHSININDWLNSHAWAKADYVGFRPKKSADAGLIQHALETRIVFDVQVGLTNEENNITLTRDFTWVDSNKNSGIAFNNIWTITQ